jgi:hypothetical protein
MGEKAGKRASGEAANRLSGKAACRAAKKSRFAALLIAKRKQMSPVQF